MIAGIDCSSKAVHIVVLDENDEICLTYRTPLIIEKTKDMYDRFYALGDALARLLLSVDYAAIETPIYVNNIKSTVSISQVVGIVSWFLRQQKINVVHVDNRVWKKSILGRGAATKEEIMTFAKNKWKRELFLEQDFADAACIALWQLRQS